MINCQVLQDGKMRDALVQPQGLMFRDNHGVERCHSYNSELIDASLDEWHYDRFGIICQHFRGKQDNVRFDIAHEVMPALMFSVATEGAAVKNIYAGNRHSQEVTWNVGEANMFTVSGCGSLSINLSRNRSLDITSVVIPQRFVDDLIARDCESLETLARFTRNDFDHHLMFRQNRRIGVDVMKAARDIRRCRMMGNNAHNYLQSKIIDCLTGFLAPEGITAAVIATSRMIRDKMHDVRDIILAHYQDMPSLNRLAAMVGTNECTLKRAFKHEFGNTVFGFLFDYRMELAAKYLRDTSMSIGDIGAALGYDYQSHFCTAFKRRYGVSPLEFRAKH